jgi:succinate dehydrogenase / fumarate reductase membrane anchor subunit
MRYLTDRKRATGLGSAKTGTEHFWHMQISSVALAILLPLFIFTFGRVVGAPYETVVAYFGRPFPALIAGLTILVGMTHFKNGAQVMIEDYARLHPQGADRRDDLPVLCGDRHRALRADPARALKD